MITKLTEIYSKDDFLLFFPLFTYMCCHMAKKYENDQHTTGTKSRCLMHFSTLWRCSLDIRTGPAKFPNRTDQNSPGKGNKVSKVREGLPEESAWSQEDNRKGESSQENKGCREVRHQANATDNDMKLKKGQRNDEGDLKTQLQFKGKNKRVKEEKTLTWRSSIPQKIQWSCDHQGMFVSERLCICIYFAIFTLPSRVLS